MTQDPTPYDLLQDAEISALQELVTPYYQPPSEAEHSFPVVGQGVNSEQYQLMSLAQGDGIITTDEGTHSHALTLLPGGPSETNSQNQMLLNVARNTGRAEAVLGGFYHVLYDNMPIDLPPVTTPTTYYVCITLDPRREEEPAGPLHVEVYTTTPPTTHGRKHIILHTVERQPNQLLTDATHTVRRQSISPTITVSSASQLPDATQVLHHTLGIVRNRVASGTQVEGTGQLYEARGTAGWRNLLVGPWRNLPTFSAGWNAAYAVVRHRLGGIDLVARGSIVNPANAIFQLPSDMALSRSFYTPVQRAGNVNTTQLNINQGNGRGYIHSGTTSGFVNIDIFIPDYYLAN